MRTIVGISGKQRAGKDTLAAHLITALHGRGLDFTRCALADALKLDWAKYVRWGMGLSPVEVIAMVDAAKNKDPEVRRALIDFGQAKKVGNPYYWVNRTLVSPGNLIIPDIRYVCEIERLKEVEADASEPTRLVLVRVECSREVRAERGTLSNETDPSETELDHYRGWDAIVDNDGTCSIQREAEYVARLVVCPAFRLWDIPV